MAMTATVVVITSLAVERSGAFVGALIGALPTAAGAAYTILALEHPPSFIAASAIGSVAINAAVAVFAATYALLAQGHGLFVSLVARIGCEPCSRRRNQRRSRHCTLHKLPPAQTHTRSPFL